MNDNLIESKKQKQSKNIKLLRFFTEHPSSIGETYFEHFLVAISFSFKLLITSFAAFIHAFLPFFFKTFASKQIKEMNKKLTIRK